MVYVRLMGGLGNQMFQYAAGRALALKLGTKLSVDLSFLQRPTEGAYTKRDYELCIFSGSPRTNGFVENIYIRLAGKIRRKLNWPPILPLIFQENNMDYDARFADLRDPVILIGYWQSEKYFRQFRRTLLDDFNITAARSTEARAIHYDIQRQHSPVALHFRRGDYVTLASAAAVHGAMSNAYYESAIALVLKKVPQAHFFIFSDDPKWVSENIRLPNATIIKGLKAYEDLWLMSSCRHNIIANSSFSWWGAWLGTQKDKIVIAPKYWFQDREVKTPDLIPDSWIRL